MFDLKLFFKKQKEQREELAQKFKQEVIPKVSTFLRGATKTVEQLKPENIGGAFKQDIVPKVTTLLKSPFTKVEKEPIRRTFETEEEFTERQKTPEPLEARLPTTKTQAGAFIKEVGARLPEELIKGGARAVQTAGQLAKIKLFGKDISEKTPIPKSLQRFVGNEENLESYYVEFAKCVEDEGGNPYACSAKSAFKFALDTTILMDFALAGIRSGIKAIPINKTIADVTHKSAWLKLGKPKNIEEAEAIYKNILMDVSPLSSKANRLKTVDTKITKDVNNAFEILKAKGIPNTSKLGEALGKLEQPTTIKDLFREMAKKREEVGFARPAGLIPEQAGTIPTEPLQPKQFPFGLSTRDIKAKPIMPKTAPQAFRTTDIQGNTIEQQLARKATELEKKSPTAKSRGYNSIPDKEGYEKVFKPYGEEGAGYYYSKKVTAPQRVIGDTIEDVTPKGFGVKKGVETKIPLERLKGETADQAIARKVGYQIDNGLVKLEQDPIQHGWKATVTGMGDNDVQVFRGFKKEQVEQQVFEKLYPEVDLTGKTIPLSPIDDTLAVEARKAVAEGKGAEEFVKAQPKVFHGSAFEFSHFNKAQRGRITKAPSAKEATFFTSKREIAQGYAELGGGEEVIKLREQAEILEKQARRTGDMKLFDKATKIFNRADDIEIQNQRLGKIPQGQIIEARVDLKNPFIKDMDGKAFQEVEAIKTVREAKAKGYDGVIFKNVADAVDTPIASKEIRPAEELSDVYAIFDNKQILTKSQLTDIYNEAQKATLPTRQKAPILQTRLKELRKATAQEELQKKTIQEKRIVNNAGNIVSSKNLSKTVQDVESYKNDNIQETIVNKNIEKAIIKKDTTNTVKDASTPPKEPQEDIITTRKFKQTDEWKDFAKYAEENLQDKDISPAILFRHMTMTMERVAEFLDGGIGGRTYREIVKPVYDSAKKMQLEGKTIKEEFDSFRVLEGSIIDRDASLFAQKKLNDVPQKAKDIAKYTRDKYDEFLERLNVVRKKIGEEDILKKQDYITHINELNVLSELFGGMERISVKRHISALKSELLDQHPNWTDARAFDAAKRKVEGLTGIAQYVDARQPIFKFAKRRLGEYEANPSITRSFNAYSQNALRYIYQAENVARNKAFKDVLPANAREFARLWNTEQVAGRQAPSFLNPISKRALSAVRGTLGANTILGNMATTMMQMTSWAQVFALAGVRNTFYGLGSRLRTYIPGLTNQFNVSRTRYLRNLNIDIGLGDSLIDKMLINIGKYEALRNPAARTRYSIDIGRNFLMAIMETADQFTVGATYQAFYRKGVLDGLTPQKAVEFAEIMTGKTQANYFKEALPPFLNTIEGKTLGQFGTYGMNQWEMFRKDFGKDFKLDEKNPKSVKRFFTQFMIFLTSAYIIDSISEETFGRQPYNIKELIDDSVGFAKGELTGGQLIDTSKETVMTYIPFMGSVKFDSMPPVLEFGNTVKNSILATSEKQENAINDLKEKWIYNILLPYGGNQARKSLQGLETSIDVDLPFVRNISKNIDIQTNIDKAKAILFSPYATEESINYFKNRDRREGIKEKLDITGTITSDENIAKLKKMTKEEFQLYTAQYAESTLKTINNKMGKTTTTQSRLQRLRKLQELRQLRNK